MASEKQQIDFGAKLRSARERSGLSLRVIADTTRISVRALEALERNDITHLPGGIFSRGFVRAYARQVGLDPEETIAEFITRFPHEIVTQGHPRTRAIIDELDAGTRRVRWPRLAWIGVAAVLIVALLAYLALGGWRDLQPRSLAGPLPLTPQTLQNTPVRQ
jgi:cytoskeleton protein RodZ